MRACAEFERLFDPLLAGELPAREAAALRAHAAGCTRCGPLLRIAEGGAATAAAPEDLTDRVLARTSGSACSSVEERLCDLVDEALQPSEQALIQEHLSHCAACRELEEALAALKRELPELAEIDPGPAFARRVAQATARRVTAGRTMGGRIQLLWESTLRRPRFALELAYSGALVLTLLVELPGSPLARVPEQAIGLTRASPSVVQGVERSVETAAGAVPFLQEIWMEEASPLVARARAASTGTLAAIRSFGPISTVLVQRGGAMLTRVIRGDLPGAAGEWTELRREVTGLWAASRSRRP